MGSYSSKNNNNDTEIQNLKNQLIEKSSLITILGQELNVLRNTGNDNSLNPAVLKEINEAYKTFDYEYLVFSGGAIKGISFVGALLELEKRGILHDTNGNLKIKGIAAVSAGSLLAVLLAIGYSVNEILGIMNNVKLKRIFDDDLSHLRHSLNFIQEWGICPGAYVQELLGELIKQKTGNEDYTLEDLLKDKNIKLVIVSTDMCTERSVYLYAGNPVAEFSKIPIKKAVRCSLGVPFAFEPYKYNNCLLVDGGVLDNYPLHVFDGEYPGDPKARLNLCAPNSKVLGLRIMTTNDQLDYQLVNRQNFNHLYNYAYSFIDTFLAENDRRMMTPSFWLRSIIIVTPAYSITKTSVTDEERNQLVQLGQKYVSEFFDNSDKVTNYINFKLKLLQDC
jgi:NTE family protein